MRQMELKQVCGNCQWIVPNITDEPYCMFDGHTMKPDDEACNRYSFNIGLKKSLENIDAIEADAERQFELMRKGMERKSEYVG